jgi:hypothetical protein
MVALSYNAGKPLSVSMEDFWKGNDDNTPEIESKLFIVNHSHVKIPSNILHLAVLHLMCFC